MSYLVSELKRQMDVKGMKPVDLARVTKISEATLSMLFNGTKEWISPKHLEKICLALSNKKQDWARLLAARLEDEKKGPGAELIEIVTHGLDTLPLREASPAFETPLVPKKEKILKTLRQHPDDPDAWNVLESVAAMLERQDPTA